MTSYDAVVIGAGPGGYVCAIRLAQLGNRTALVERSELGGECTNVGCIPSKLLVSYANKMYEAKKLLSQSLATGNISPDLAKLSEKKRGVLERLRKGIDYLLKSNGVEVFSGEGRITNPELVEVTSFNSSHSLPTRNIVLATGTELMSLPNIPYGGRVISHVEALSLERLPRRILVVGGGAIGLELGTAYAKLGSGVVIVELMNQLLPGLDQDLSRVVQKSLQRMGVKVHLGSTVQSYSNGDDSISIHLTTGEEYSADYVLVAVGKRPPASGAYLRDMGAAFDQRGFIKTNERMETSIKGVYAVGDITGPPFYAHKAAKQGIVAAEAISGMESTFDNRAVPGGIFTDPEIGTVGMTEDEARAKGYSATTYKFPYSALGRAILEDHVEGFVKLVTDSSTGGLLGLHVAGPHATELVNEGALALEAGFRAEEVGYTIHVHPTFSESLAEAAHLSMKRPIHIVQR